VFATPQLEPGVQSQRPSPKIDQAANWRYVEFFTANINNDHTRLCARLQPVFRLVRRSRALAHGHSAIRRRGLGERPAADTRGTGCEAAACGCAHTVRLAHHRADRTDEPGGGGARAQACRQDRQDAGARGATNGENYSPRFRPPPCAILRDRALIATLTYSFARIGAALKMKVEDLRPRGAGWTVRLHEKGGKEHAMPCHHALAEALRAFIDAAGIAEDRKGWLFRTARAQSRYAVRPRHEPVRRLVHDPPPRQGGRRHGADRLPRFAPPGLPPISPTAVRSSTPRKWPRMRARGQLNFMTPPRSGSHKTRLSTFGFTTT
jgi:Phage integrase family